MQRNRKICCILRRKLQSDYQVNNYSLCTPRMNIAKAMSNKITSKIRNKPNKVVKFSSHVFSRLANKANVLSKTTFSSKREKTLMKY